VGKAGSPILKEWIDFEASCFGFQVTTLAAVFYRESAMPRRLRLHVAGGFYHVTLRGNHQQDLFRAEEDRFLLNAIVARGLAHYGAQLHAYCWMTNHLHFLVRVGQQPLSGVMRQIASGYARAFQSKLETTGHLFERRYHAILVDADAYFLQLLRYIHLNPVKAGLVQRPGQYRWSSHGAYAGGAQESWLTTDFALSMFASDTRAAHAAYLRFIDAPESDEDFEAFTTTDSRILGDASFVARFSAVAPVTVATQSLDALLVEACRVFGTTEREIRSDSRERTAVRARAWVASEAVSRRIATLSAVARALGRDRATLRYAMRQHAPTGN
jgi:putative transposase